jgi:hypothetical protein
MAIVVAGLTLTVNVEAAPTQPLAVGVIVIVEVIGDVDGFIVANEGISPEPFAASPMAVLLFVHVNVVPAMGPDNVVNGATVPVQ